MEKEDYELKDHYTSSTRPMKEFMRANGVSQLAPSNFCSNRSHGNHHDNYELLCRPSHPHRRQTSAVLLSSPTTVIRVYWRMA